MSGLSCVILAAGRSTRFPAPQGKIFYPLAGCPLIGHLLQTIASCCFEKVIVVAQKEQHGMFAELQELYGFQLAYQDELDGTWSALKAALPLVHSEKFILINGDQPLVDKSLIQKLMICHKDFALVSARTPFPKGYGRIIRDQDDCWVDLVEEKDLLSHQKMIQEVNAGVYLLSRSKIMDWEIAPSHQTKERYLTQLWSKNGFCSQTELIEAEDFRSIQGVNTWSDFEQVEQYYYFKQRENLAHQGAILQNCQGIIVQDARKIQLERGTKISGPAFLDGSITAKQHAHIKSFTTVIGQDCFFGVNAEIGPYAFVQSHVHAADRVHLGAFVEIKRSQLGSSTKSKHFSYIADATVGERNNIGAFVVFCNYDGQRKHRSELGSDVFVGSSSQIIAPIKIGDYSYIGAGTTVTHDIEPHRLITRRAPWRDRPNTIKGENLCVASSGASASI